MDQKSFTQELAKLTAIPMAQAAKAQAVARSLSDADREAFFRKLVTIDGELKEAERKELKALEAFEVSLMDLEKHLTRSIRSQAEAGERRKDARKAEAKLKKYS